jgi:hypothetical protein
MSAPVVTGNFMDAVAFLVRKTVGTALGWSDNLVIPAKATHPAKGQTDKFSTMSIIHIGEDSQPVREYAPALDDAGHPTGDVTETLSVPETFTASFNFYRNPTQDAEGLAVYGNEAYSDAERLARVLRLSPAREQLQKYGLGFVQAATVQDLTALVAGTNWENRAQVDIDFAVVNASQAVLATYTTIQVALRGQRAGASATENTTFEVTP